MKVLIACESSGSTREAFRALGHDAWSCDLLPADDGSCYHFTTDVSTILDSSWDLMLGHPPCTYLSSSGLHWNKRVVGRANLTEQALEFVQLLLNAPIRHIAIENPVGCIGTRIRPANQYIQPYDFGHDASKKTGLWLKNLPPLISTQKIAPRYVDGKPRWANQTDSGQNRLAPSLDRWKIRSKTYSGISLAMAKQWSIAAAYASM
jgi:hypothetical protein